MTENLSSIQELVSFIQEQGSTDFLNVLNTPSQSSQLPDHEEIIFSDTITKINRKLRPQLRVLVITDVAVYNIHPDTFITKRRIEITRLHQVTLCAETEDFKLNVVNEPDYWFNSVRRSMILRILNNLFVQLAKRELAVKVSSLSDMQNTSFMQKGLAKTEIEDSYISASVYESSGDEDSDHEAPNKLARVASSTQNAEKVNVLTSKIRGLVSKKKKRFQKDGFDLDLTYITRNLIAMGFPSEDVEGLYRNPMPQVQKFLTLKHDKKHKIYNLCSERRYDPSKFQNMVAIFPFDDHNCPSIKLILDFCDNVDAWLASDPENVAVVHCKAGKGRTGLMLSCYMLYCRMFENPQDSLDYFGKKRTDNGKGVTIPSQRRFVRYFHRFLTEYENSSVSPNTPRPSFPFIYGVPLVLTNVLIETIPRMSGDGSCTPYFKIQRIDGEKIYDSRKIAKSTRYSKMKKQLDLVSTARIRGNVKIIFYHEDKYGAGTQMFACWINTAFVKNGYLRLEKNELDKAVKDTSHKRFDENLRVHLHFRVDDIAVMDKSNPIIWKMNEFEPDKMQERRRSVDEKYNNLVKHTERVIKVYERERRDTCLAEEEMMEIVALTEQLEFESRIYQSNENVSTKIVFEDLR